LHPFQSAINLYLPGLLKRDDMFGLDLKGRPFIIPLVFFREAVNVIIAETQVSADRGAVR
jgi:hypothetical protein